RRHQLQTGFSTTYFEIPVSRTHFHNVLEGLVVIQTTSQESLKVTVQICKYWWTRRDSNPRPPRCENRHLGWMERTWMGRNWKRKRSNKLRLFQVTNPFRTDLHLEVPNCTGEQNRVMAQSTA